MKTILDQFKLDGKIALVTGAARGLGQAISLAMAEAGADVALVDLLSTDETKRKIEEIGRKAIGIHADLSSISCIPVIVATTIKAFGKIDILVNNAGIIRRAPLTEFSEKDWDDVINLNQKAVFFLSQAVARTMIERKQGGKIVNIASLLSFQGGILVPSYTASKSAVMGLTRALANELAPHGITVNAIAPGYMATDNTAPLRSDAKRSQAILERIPAGRWGTPDDLKGVAVFLASAASDYMNGYTIAVDGGWLAR
ncbi:MAG: 2-dehydro-3-deoxy-D-gluconate 5-dehydrogenase KduD [Candidatus Marinimicrobia bacterium]|nr:2-dehydro-3-deoxy-D-gluconate 5-dehydrogenase KduD [Candidatus Neomarinimicrobiota bacterium]